MSSERRELLSRRNHVTQKARVAGRRTIYVSVHDDASPGEIFLRVKGTDCSAETVGLYDVLARVASLALQYGAPLEKVGAMLLGSKFEPAGPVTLHPRIKNCTSLPDLIGRHLLVEFCNRADLAHVSEENNEGRN
ncbi:MAG: Ribonucleotide reductase of class II (coenzyme B12-dependent) [Nitrospira sp.]|jgi:ribonucleoside-diphosphate reductase alpha chain|nr:Ribonucleotide reductase of class II (coenzyme B12-dependent) [Nitrospira sp.]